jgi:transcription initiation factor TFIIIB Brf1 subunit/transcription initiation factor TFIIB
LKVVPKHGLDNTNNEENNTTDTSSMKNNTLPVKAGEGMEVPMDRAEFQKEHPAIYGEVDKSGEDRGVKIERERVAAHLVLKNSDDYKDIPEVVEVIEKGIEEGRSIEATQTAMNAAMVKLMKKPGKLDEIESPGDIKGGNGADMSTAPAKRQEA